MEEEIIKKIRVNFKAIKNGTPPRDTNIGFCLNKLKEINDGMYEDYLKEYKQILAQVKN